MRPGVTRARRSRQPSSATPVAIVCFHNHPSGDPYPSNEDRLLTARLKKAGDTIGIQLLDHVVLADAGHYESEISGQTYYSFKEHGEV